MALDHKSKQTSPNGMVLIWNYRDRIVADGASDPNEVEQVILNTASLVSMSTSKNKASPAGSFEFRLAPTHNWVSRITPGSWCALLMTQSNIIPPTTNVFPGFVDPRTFKMLGRINSVRAVVDVDQETGARNTSYVVTGEDWGSVFNTKLYIDPIARNNNLDTAPAVGHAARIIFDDMLLDWLQSKKATLPTASQIVQALIRLWGDPLSGVSSAFGAEGLNTELVITSQAQFKLPLQVALYMKLANPSNIPSINLASLIHVVDGVLTGEDKYSGDPEEAFGFPNPSSLYGLNTFWQLLVDNSNPALNELVTDIRFEGNTPKLALYRRIRPFINRPIFEGSFFPGVQSNISMFKDVKKVAIDLEDVVSINAGTNWRDKMNFIEIQPQPQLNQTNFEVQVKLDSQTTDLKAYERDGFKPMIHRVGYLPYDNGEPAPLKATDWKYLLREWHFNTHNLLNGAVTFIGQDKYIQVGDNIQIDSKILGAPFNEAQKIAQQTGQATYLLAHVESVNHNFTVGENGERSFLTTVQFVRGIIAFESGLPVDLIGSNSGGGLDQDAGALSSSDEKNKNVLGTSTATDPDIQKLRGR